MMRVTTVPPTAEQDLARCLDLARRLSDAADAMDQHAQRIEMASPIASQAVPDSSDLGILDCVKYRHAVGGAIAALHGGPEARPLLARVADAIERLNSALLRSAGLRSA